MQLSFEKVYPNMHDLWDKKVGVFYNDPKTEVAKGFWVKND